MMFDVHPLHPSRPSPSQKLNRENRIKNACLSNSHSNIAPSNDKRPLFVQIPATSSASLVSTSLPVQCLRLSNFFFFRRIFLNSFLCDQILFTRDRILMTHELFYLSRDRILITHELFYLSRNQILMKRELFYLSRDQILMIHELFHLSRDRILMRLQHKRLVYEVLPEKGKPPHCSLEAERGLSSQMVCGRTHRPALI